MARRVPGNTTPLTENKHFNNKFNMIICEAGDSFGVNKIKQLNNKMINKISMQS